MKIGDIIQEKNDTSQKFLLCSEDFYSDGLFMNWQERYLLVDVSSGEVYDSSSSLEAISRNYEKSNARIEDIRQDYNREETRRYEIVMDNRRKLHTFLSGDALSRLIKSVESGSGMVKAQTLEGNRLFINASKIMSVVEV